MEKRFENFTISVLKLNKLVQKIKVYEMKEYDLKAIHVMCIYYLAQNPKGLKASELSRLTLEDKAAISRALALLVEKGFIQYDSNGYNANIRITYEGQKVANYITLKSQAAVAAGGKDLTDDERDIFYRALMSIAENLEEYYNNLPKN
jgi:DNA-binding MarR family transcriptional regulator